MSSFTDEMISLGLGNLIDKYVDEVILTDEAYLTETDTASNCFDKLFESDLSEEQRNLLQEYDEHMNVAYARVRAIAYLIGVRNMAIFMKELTPAEYTKIITTGKDN